MVILTLESIVKEYADRPLLAGVSLAVEAGERVGVVGVNGSGKTTLLRIAAGDEQPDAGSVTTARDLRIAYLPQQLVLDPDLTVIEQVFRGNSPEMQLLRDYEHAATALARAPGDVVLQQRVAALVERMDAIDAWGVETAARAILSRLGIHNLDARVGDLSGGLRKRVAMAAALIHPSDLLILDEPTNHIDVDTVAWLEGFLARSNAALLLVTHDRYFLERVVQRIVEIDRGQLYAYPGAYERFLELKAERAAQQAVAEERRQIILRKELAWLRRGARARTTKQQARIDRISALQEEDPGDQPGGLAISVAARRLGKKVIELRGVAKSYAGRELFSDLSLEIDRRDRLGIVGPNGSGKTTLLNIIAGRLQPDRGSVDVGETVHLSYYDQESAGLDESLRVIDYIREGAELIRTGEGALVTAAQMLERFLFPSPAHYTPIAKLSGGERRRLYLLRKLVTAPNVLLLDEPTNDLDIQTLGVLEDYLDDFDGAVVVVSHDRYFLDRTMARLLSFEDGRVVEYPGSYSYYAAERARRAAEQAISERAKSAPAQRAAPKPVDRPRKLTFREQRELAELEQRVAALETEQAALEQQVNAAAGDYQELARLTSALERVGAELERAVERWAELAEIAEGSR